MIHAMHQLVFYRYLKVNKIMPGIDFVISRRQKQKMYDKELWAFMSKIDGRRLINLTDIELQDRLNVIDRNIQYLDDGSSNRDSLREDRGWLSPWWWLRTRFWTLQEFEHRELVPCSTPVIPQMPSLSVGLTGVIGGGRRMLVRISKIKWLMETLNNGVLRFAHANIYRNSALDAARHDDELNKTYRRPSQAIHISSLDGKKIESVGDVAFSTCRVVDNGTRLIEMPYWMCSFSSDLDPRLFDEFGSKEDPTEDGCIVIFEPNTFVQRALSPLITIAPTARKLLFPTDYFDPYYPCQDALSTIKSKDFSYAYQREMRFVLDPESSRWFGNDKEIFIEIGSIADIAGVYTRGGRKLAGVGPDSFLA